MREAAIRRRLVARWHAGARLKRTDIFGKGDALRPIYDLPGPPNTQVDIPAMGMVGPSYKPGGLALVSVNPAGGKPGATSTPADDALYNTIEALRDSNSDIEAASHFEQLGERFIASAPQWTIWRQYLRPILNALSHEFGASAYLYLVPFRTSGDAGSRMPDTFLTAGFERHLVNQLNDIRPKLIVAVDRPSERYSRKWAQDSDPDCEVIYYTRKRDAHAERARLLEELRQRHGT